MTTLNPYRLRNEAQRVELEEHRYYLGIKRKEFIPEMEAATDFINKGYAQRFAERWEKYGSLFSSVAKKIKKRSKNLDSERAICLHLKEQGLLHLLLHDG